MTWLFQIVSLLLAVLWELQSPAIPLCAGLKLPLLHSCVLYYSLVHRRSLWVTAAILGGLLHGAMTEGPVGPDMWLLLLFGLGASRFRQHLVAEAAMTGVVLGAIWGVLFQWCLAFVLLRAGAIESPGIGLMVVRSLAAALLGALTAPVVFLLLGWAEHVLGSRDRSEGYA